MAEYYAIDDIYSEDGILLISKGKKITNNVIAKLQRYGNLKIEDLIISNNQQSKKQHNQQNNVIDVTIKTFETRKNIRSSFHLEQSSKILSTIIFESKTRPWWIHINALGNYLDWLYTHS
ncbi:MAG: phosphohydrolase, partial [Clostridiales bacterium]|nr:phosphohydrolase [Clostridiales bacterium]